MRWGDDEGVPRWFGDCRGTSCADEAEGKGCFEGESVARLFLRFFRPNGPPPTSAVLGPFLKESKCWVWIESVPPLEECRLLRVAVSMVAGLTVIRSVDECGLGAADSVG